MSEASQLERIANALEKMADTPMMSVVNNPPADPPSLGRPDKVTYAMLVGVTTGFAYSLREILDDPTMDGFKKAQRLRKQVTIAEGMAQEYQAKLDELKELDKQDGRA
jgi:hypothetical protein